MCRSTEPASSWTCFVVNVLGAASPFPARCLMRGDVNGDGLGGVDFLGILIGPSVWL